MNTTSTGCPYDCYSTKLYGNCVIRENESVCSCLLGHYGSDCGTSILDLASMEWNSFWITILLLYVFAIIFIVYGIIRNFLNPDKEAAREIRYFFRLVKLTTLDNVICLLICVDTILYCVLDPGGFRGYNISPAIRLSIEYAVFPMIASKFSLYAFGWIRMFFATEHTQNVESQIASINSTYEPDVNLGKIEKDLPKRARFTRIIFISINIIDYMMYIVTMITALVQSQSGTTITIFLTILEIWISYFSLLYIIFTVIFIGFAIRFLRYIDKYDKLIPACKRETKKRIIHSTVFIGGYLLSIISLVWQNPTGLLLGVWFFRLSILVMIGITIFD